MAEILGAYETIKWWKDENISKHLSDLSSLNEFHDQVMTRVFDLAVKQLNKGEPPCSYSWFITGSGGRFEQGVISDQDHGIIFEQFSEENEAYFRELGKELSYGLNIVGYPYCQGNVMSSNPIWCKSLNAWKEQINGWMIDESWESIRFLQIFYDARVLNGEVKYVESLKALIYDFQSKHPSLLNRFKENVMHIKKALTPLGQIVGEEYGENQGFIDLKYTAYIPYVNAIRLLSIKEGLYETSTLERMNQLIWINGYGAELRMSKKHFLDLQKYRLSLLSVESYEKTHFLNISNLRKGEIKELKQILKGGKRLHQYVNRIIDNP